MFPYRPALLAAAALVAVSPIASSFAQESPAKEYDLKAEALLQRTADRLKAAQSFSGQVETVSNYPAVGTTPARELRNVRTFRLQKPNLVFQEQAKKTKGSSGIWLTETQAKTVSDGKTGVMMMTGTKEYRKMGVTPRTIGTTYGLNFGEFFDPTNSDVEQAREMKKNGSLVSLKMASDATFGGVACSVVEEKTIENKTPKGTTYRTTKIYIGKKDDVIRGYHIEVPLPTGEGTFQSDQIVTNVAVGDKIPASVFAVNLTGYKEFVAPKQPELLTAGTLAPDFTAYDKDNKPVKLSDFKGKVVVIDFWASWCPPCKASMPHNQEVASKLQKDGIPVVLLAVDNSEERPAFLTWVGEHEKELNALTFVHADRKVSNIVGAQYNVSGIPTQYIVSPDGKIVASFVGFGGPTDDLEKAIKKANASTLISQK